MFLTRNEVKTLIRLRQYIERNEHHPIYIPDLVRQFGLKESKLTKGFKQLFKMSIYNYYLKCSMQLAKTMLESGAQVKEVALTLGYTESRSFSRAFTRVYGQAPISVRLQK